MYFVRRQNERFISRLLGRYMSSSAKKSYYEVLNVPRTCTDKDIRQAFIRMSKQLHPDKNKGANTHEAFVRVVEAYNVLSKPSTRAQYDARGVYASYARSASHGYSEPASSYGRKSGERKFYDDFHEYRERSHGAYNDANPYYGFAGNKKRTNMTVLAVCLAVTCVGVLLQVFVISASFQSGRRIANERSMRNARDLNAVRTKAAENGNETRDGEEYSLLDSKPPLTKSEMQAQMMLKQITEASSHTVATATLAHTLTAKPK